MPPSRKRLRGGALVDQLLITDFYPGMDIDAGPATGGTTRTFRGRFGGSRLPPIIGSQPRSRRSISRSQKGPRRVSGIARMQYKLGTVLPATVVRSRSYSVNAAQGEQALVTYMTCKLRSMIREVGTLTALTSTPGNEVDIDRRPRSTAGVLRTNFEYIDTLQRFVQGSSATQSRAAVPGHAWTLGDNWMFRDMIYYLRRGYSPTTVQLGFIPPSPETIVGSTSATYCGLVPGLGGVTNPVYGCVAVNDPSSEADTNTQLLRVDQRYMTLAPDYNTTSNPGLQDPGIDSKAKTLYVHSMGIDFAVTNLEENPVDVTFYELVLRDHERFTYAGLVTGDPTTTTAAPCNAGLVDPVEWWQTWMNQCRNTSKPAEYLVGPAQGNQEAANYSTYNRRSVYESGMDPLHYLNRFYYVKKRTARIEPLGKFTFKFNVVMNRTLKGWWLDQLYGVKGITRTYMMRVCGSAALARTNATMNLGSSLGRTTTDCSVRVDVDKYWRASMLPLRGKAAYIMRPPRISPASITATVEMDAEGNLESGTELNVTGTTTQKISFAENTGQLI